MLAIKPWDCEAQGCTGTGNATFRESRRHCHIYLLLPAARVLPVTPHRAEKPLGIGIR